jgi:hypothetical protein
MIHPADTSVQTGQDSLQSGNFPWYDSKSDAFREVEKPVEETQHETTISAPSAISMPIASVFGWAVLFLVIATLLYFLIRAFIDADMRPRVKSEEKRTGKARRIEALPMNLDARESDLLAAARRFYEQGNYAQAIVYYFGYQLVEIDHRQLIHLTPGKTNRQYLREMGKRMQLRALVDQTMVVSEAAYFGHHAPPREVFEMCWARQQEFHNLLGQEVRT